MKTTKKITLIATAAIGLLCTKQSFGQWTNSGTNIYNSNSGDVGIGLTAPQNLLDISSGSRSGTHVSGYALYVTGSLGTESGIRFAHDNGSQGINFGYEGISKYTNNGSNNLYMDAASTGNLLFQTSATGNVGINTTSPAAKLDVNGATSTGQVAFFRNGNYNSFLTNNMSSSNFNSLTAANDNGIFWTDGAGSGGMNSSSGFVIAPWQNSYYGLRIDGSNGNLDINGGCTAAYIGVCPSSSIGYGTSYIGFNAIRLSSGWTTYTNSVNNGGATIYGDIFGDLRFVTLPNSSGSSNHTGISDATVNNNTILKISSSGKVIIGNPFASSGAITTDNVTTPGSYQLYVAGGILTEQLNVAVVNSGGWADYVFADGYKLKPLNEVAQYIQQNKHLPGVPSADEVKDKGIDVATMDATLLKKIEELTLYVIELKKDKDADTTRIDELEKQLQALTANK